MEQQLLVRYLTTKQACLYLGIGRTTLHNKVKEGKVGRIMDGGLIRFDINELDRYMKVHSLGGS